MFERFTEEARQVVVLAQDEARLLGHDYIGTEHILLGLLREEDGVAAAVLESAGVNLDQVREDVRRLIGPGDGPKAGQVPFTPRAKKVLELALREAQRLGHSHIGTEHLLLGLLREDEGVAIRMLSDRGIDRDALREQVLNAVPRLERVGRFRGLRSIRARPEAQVVRGPARRGRDLDWLDGFAALSDRLGDEIRRELHREPDPGDLLLMLACVRDSLTGRAADALGLDLDALWGTIEQQRKRATAAEEELRRALDEVAREKELAIEERQFERAAQLRDRERELRQQELAHGTIDLDEALRVVRARLGLPRPPEAPQASATDG